MAILTNKELVQSYVVTTAKYDFSIDEKRILYRIIECLQSNLLGNKLNYRYRIQQDLLGDYEFTIPIRAFLKDENSKNYEPIKKALKSLRNKDFEYEDDKMWTVYGIIEKPVINKYDSEVKITVTPLLMDAFMNFAKGYRKYELKIAMEFKSIYSMRFYELLSGQTTPITYTIQALKEMFKIENKYKRPNHFVEKVINIAQKELKEHSPYWFEYKMNKQGRKYHSITFTPVYNPHKRDDTLEQHELQKQLSLSWDLPLNVINYLKDSFGFTQQEIRNNIDIFKDYNIKSDIMLKLAYLKKYCRDKKNPRGYIISALKKELETLENELQ